MLVRFGYVAIAYGVEDGSPNKTITAKRLSKLADQTTKREALRKILRQNLGTMRRILFYNKAHNIHLYRVTSKLVPLATHPESAGWDYCSEFRDELSELGDISRQSGCRLSAHPDHFTLLNSPKPEVLSASISDLRYHAAIFRAMGYEPAPQLVLHVGGQYKEKEKSIARFHRQFQALDDDLRLRLMIENDDKVYTASDVLAICQEVNAPMVLDIHHHRCLNNGETLASLWPAIAATWGNDRPKVHISSPKSEKDFRSHADFVSAKDLFPFLAVATQVGRDLDVMIEAKSKDSALFALMDELEGLPGIKRVEEAAIVL